MGERYDYVCFGDSYDSGIYFVRDNGISIARTDKEADAHRIAAALNREAQLVEALRWIVRVYASDDEYQEVARKALAAAGVS